MIKWAAYLIVAILPLGGLLIAWLIVRKFKRERDEARAIVQGVISKNPLPDPKGVPVSSIREALRQEQELQDEIDRYNRAIERRVDAQMHAVNTPEEARQMKTAFDEGYADGKRLIEALAVPQSLLGKSMASIPSAADFYGASKKPLSGSFDSVDINWDHMAKALGVKVRNSDSDVVYVISPDEFQQLKADIELHCIDGASIVATEKDGLVTVQIGGVTYRLAKELFVLLSTFWESKSTAAGGHYR